MRSSTSSSESKLWKKTWVVALAIGLVLLGSWETFWRLRGFSPKLNNNVDLWVLARRRASGAGEKSVIVIGSSRMQLGIDPGSFAEATGWERPIQLAIPMGPMRPILRDLASDPSVSGTIVCGINPQISFDAAGRLNNVPNAHLRRYAAFTPADVAEARLRTFTQRTLVAGLPALFPQQLLLALRAGRWPTPGYVEVDLQRYGQADFSRFAGLEDHIRRRRKQWARGWSGRPADARQLARIARDLNGSIGRVRAKGGDVIFVRMPTSGEVLQWEREMFPRSAFWDVLARRVDAVMIHFEDHPELRGFRLPDGSHLDRRQAPAFSRALGAVLVRELRRRARV